MILEIISIAIVALAFGLMVQEGELFDFYLPMVKRMLNIKNDKDAAFDDSLLRRLKTKMCNALGGCLKCFSGQMALWYFVFFKPLSVVIFPFIASVIILVFITTEILKICQIIDLT